LLVVGSIVQRIVARRGVMGKQLSKALHQAGDPSSGDMILSASAG
jgi:hypothetical protein